MTRWSLLHGPVGSAGNGRLRSLLVAAVLLCLLPVAAADERPEAEREMGKANAALVAHKYEEAIARYNVARKLSPNSSGPYLGLGLAYAATDRCREAVAYLEEYLQRQKSPKPEAQANIDACRPKMVQPGRLKVSSDPPGAEVRVDDESGPLIGITPFEKTDLTRGLHRVYIARNGYRQHTADVVVEPGVVSMVTASLEALGGLPSAPQESPDRSTAPTEWKPEPPKPAEGEKPPEAVKTTPPGQHVASLDPAKPPEIVDPTQPMSTRTTSEPSRNPSSTPGATMVRMVDGELDLSASDPLTGIYVNNEQVAADGHARLRLPPGLYGVKMQRDGYRGSEGAVTLTAGDRKALKGTVKPLVSHGWIDFGVGFTLLAAVAGGGAVAGHFLGSNTFRGTDDFTIFSSLERYGYVAAGVAAAAAITGFIVDAIINRGHVQEGKPYHLEAAQWPGATP